MIVDKLSDSEIIEYALQHGDLTTQDSIAFALRGFAGVTANKKEMATLLRKAIQHGKTFRAAFDDGESCGKPRKPSIVMMVD